MDTRNSAVIELTEDVRKNLGVLETNEEWRKSLLLTDLYEVDYVTFLRDGRIRVTVLSSEIPEGCKYIRLQYKMIEGKIYLAKTDFLFSSGKNKKYAK